jgi:hypothetical protein
MSCGVAAVAAALVFLLWYPGALAQANGVTQIVLLLLLVDVSLGPLITLIIFNPQKKELKRDLSIIVVVQLAALLYGLYTVHVARPVYIVFSVDRFYLVSANELTDEKLAKAAHAEFKSVPQFGPRTVATHVDAANMGDFASSLLSGGEDAYQLPQFYVPYEQEKSQAIKNAKPLEKLEVANKAQPEKVEALKAKYASKKIDAGFLPLQGKSKDVSAVVDRQSGAVLEIVDLPPSL